MSPVALVTGGNRGIGREVCRQLAARGYAVVLGSRDLERGEEAALALPRLDAVVNNAAIHYDTWQRGVDADLQVVEEAFATNVLGTRRVVEQVLPLLRATRSGRIVNVSSGAGALTDMGRRDDGPTGGFFRDRRAIPW